ncbi:DHA2 family efflux MFS transporter permease subunit [Pectinatus haikarae]|uniref:DHA2 family multidrug resistance protein n=1 Tax=Pectinatus haikarae TaxID=349096 RepID=A0ABT9YB28_9FIRM|nr:DHA2 family efflux MFS transporter permease subunit [Pectinatus haikarae]MDQ0204751.1 DHA2 family multidrug resistance protein [Pectinatus haikarae]
MAKQVNPMLVSMAVSLATFMEILDTTIVNVALSSIAGSLGAGTDESTWVLTSYLVSNGIVLPLSGWLSSLVGRKKFFISCILGFTMTSFLCGISTSLPMLIICRLLQGLAGGGLQPSQQAIIKDSFPPAKLGMAFAITGLTTVLAPILGPSLGGYITDNFNWRWIFFMNVPVGFLAVFLVNLLVSDPPSAQKKKTVGIDCIGLGLIAVGLGALQIVLDKGQQEDWFDSSFIIIFASIAAAGLIAAIYWLTKQKNPIVKLSLFKNPSFTMPCIMLFFVGFALYSSSALLPMMVQENFGYNATLSGLVLSPAGISVMVMMPVVGRLVNRVQAKYLIAIGMLLNAFGMWFTGLATPQTDYSTFVIMRIFQTLGLPFLFIPASTLAFSKISPEDSSNASAIVSLMRNLGGSIGIAIVTNKLIHSEQIEQANLVRHLTTDNPGYREALAQSIRTIADMGVPLPQAATSALGHIYQEFIHQASILAFRDVYDFVAAVLLILAVSALFMPGNKIHGTK